jgi:hypothetical protein
MGFAATMIFYHVIGVGVAIAVLLSEPRKRHLPLIFQMATAVVFWPLYLPILLARPRPVAKPEIAPPESRDDAMSHTISQVEAELETALASLDGWVEDVLAHENVRFHELSSAWRAQAARIREMDCLLALTEPPGREHAPGAGAQPSQRFRQSEQSRRANLERLRQVRSKAYDDLMDTLAWVRELVSMIHLAKFTGAPASRAEELVAQIAAAVEGISAVTWQESVSDSAERPTRPDSLPGPSHEELLPCDYSSASATSSPQI